MLAYENIGMLKCKVTKFLQQY